MTTSESKGRFFYKTNRFESIRISNRKESIRIANWNALLLNLLGVTLPTSAVLADEVPAEREAAFADVGVGLEDDEERRTG